MTREEAIKTWLPIISMGIDNMPELKKAFDMAIKALEQELRWIPVSERLPEDSGGYLVTVKRGYVTTALWVGNAEYWNEVKAWMPLPKAYREVEE